MKTVRIPLPKPGGGFYPINDTNIDHYSLYADVDNVLIKRKQTGADIVANGGSTPQTLTYVHNLGYIPFFAAFSDAHVDGRWGILNNGYGSFTVPENITGADLTNLYITNFEAQDVQTAYDLFYDDMSNTGNPLITELKGSRLFKFARPGKTALSLNPNDYIIHSQLNNFKILKQGTSLAKNIVAGGIFTPTLIAHNGNITTPVKAFIFLKFPDGKTTLLGSVGATYSMDHTKGSVTCKITTTNIEIYSFNGSDMTCDVAWVIYGSGVDDNTLITNPIIDVPMPGYNAKTEKNPDHFAFHSRYPTLKYYYSNSYDLGTISNSTTITIAHNLGYVPFFIGFVNDFQSFINANTYAITPYYSADSYSGHTAHDIVANVFADSTNLYLDVYYQTNAVGTNKSFKFYYKIFKNNLGL